MREDYEESEDDNDRIIEEYLFKNFEINRVSLVIGVPQMNS